LEKQYSFHGFYQQFKNENNAFQYYIKTDGAAVMEKSGLIFLQEARSQPCMKKKVIRSRLLSVIYR